MILNDVKFIFDSLLMYMHVIFAFGTNLDPIMLAIPRLRTLSAFRYALFVFDVTLTVLKPLKLLTTTSLTQGSLIICFYK